MVRDAAAKVIDSFHSVTAPQYDSRLDDLECLASGCEFETGPNGEPTDNLICIWFEIVERPRGGEWRGYRVVKVSELKYLPQEARADAGLIRKQASILRGLYAAGVELVNLHFGVFDPPLGVVQCYGAIGRHRTREGALKLAENGHAAVIASLAAHYSQSRYAPLAGARARWLWDALFRMPRVTALVGHPDPREGARGGGQQQSGGATPPGKPGVFSEQQNEILFRALARTKEEFLFMNIATPIARRDIAGMLESLANQTSPIASRQQGVSSIGFGISLPIMLGVGQGQAAGQSYGRAEGEGVSHGLAVAHGKAHTEGVAEGSSWSYSRGIAHTEGVAETDSVTHTSGVTHSSAVSHGSSESFGTGETNSVSNTQGSAHTVGSFGSSSVGGGSTTSFGGSHTVTDPGLMMSTGLSGSMGGSFGGSLGILGSGVNSGVNSSVGSSLGLSDNLENTVSDTSSWGVSNSSTWASTSGSSVSDTVSEAVTTGHAVSESHNVGVSSSVTEGVAHSESTSVGHATSHSQAVSNSESWSQGGSHTRSSSESVAESESASLGRSYTSGISLGRALGATQMQAFGAGVAPSVSISKSFQWKDEAAVALTKLLEEQINLLTEAGEEGGFYSDVYMLTRTANGQRVAEAAAVQAFGGSQGVVTHLQPRRPAGEAERAHLLKHTRCFTPSTLTQSLGWVNGYAYSSVVTPTQQAAYSAPGLFEEGTALTVQERTPPFAFRPDMQGEADLGFLFSTERGELTDARLRLSADRHFHTLFAADTGFGKTVAAERLAVEVVNHWRHRVVVLDFGAGWRRLLNGPLERNRVDIYQLFPGASRPFRWNFLRIGRRMDPNNQYAATAELLANAGRMGPRQLAYIKQALWELYVEAGVMTAEPTVYTDPVWGVLQTDEAVALEQAYRDRGQLMPPGRESLRLIELLAFERQALAAHRSAKVNVAMLYARLKRKTDELPKGDQTARTSLGGILLRLEPFTRGELGLMYGGSESAAIEDLGLLGTEENLADRYGVCVLEGGAEMDEYAKAVVLSLAAWHLYTDSVVRQRETIGGFNRPLDIFFEEANKILSGVEQTSGNNDAGASSSPGAASLWQKMWRDGRKYSINLHPIVQTLSELPPGIQSSCNNAFLGQMKNPKDRDLAVSHIARSERGFTDEEYKRYLSRMPRKLAIVKLGYSDDVADMEPVLCQPARVPGVMPTDLDILRRFGPT